MKKTITTLFLIFSCISFAQLDKNSLLVIPVASNLTELTNITTATTGSIAYVNDISKDLYIYNGTDWIKVLDNSPVITNETIVENTDYIYVSVLIDATDWMVTRYHRADINTETNAMGTGTQPTTLVAIAALTYN